MSEVVSVFCYMWTAMLSVWRVRPCFSGPSTSVPKGRRGFLSRASLLGYGKAPEFA